MDSSELDLDRVKYHHLVYFMIHQPLSGEETQSVFLLIMSQHSGVIPGHGNSFCSAPKLDTGDMSQSLDTIIISPSYFSLVTHTSLRVSWYFCLYFLCFIVLWLDYYFVVLPSDAMLAAVKRYEVSGSAGSHGTFHLLNLHQNIQQKPPPPLPTADTVTSKLRARYLKCKINIWAALC